MIAPLYLFTPQLSKETVPARYDFETAQATGGSLAPSVSALPAAAWHALAFVLVPYLGSRLLTGAAAAAANWALPYGRPQDPGHWSLVQAWLSWDAVHYLNIARHGYSTPASSPSFSFFPGLPGLLHLTGGGAGAALVVGFVAGWCGLAVLGAFTTDLFGPTIGRRTAWVAAFWPLALIWSAVYTEAIFLALAAGCLWAAWRGRLGVSFALAFAAGLFRPTAIGLVLPLFFLLPREGLRLPNGRAGLVLLGPLAGIGAVFLIFWGLSGDPLAYLHSQSANHAVGSPVAALLGQLPERNADLFALGMLVATVLLALQLRRLGQFRAPAIATVVGFLAPALAAGAIYSIGRYAMVAFPIFWSLQRLPNRVLVLILGPACVLVAAFAGSGRLTP